MAGRAQRGGDPPGGVAHRDQRPQPPHGPVRVCPRRPDAGGLDCEQRLGGAGFDDGPGAIGDLPHGLLPHPGGVPDGLEGGGLEQPVDVAADVRRVGPRLPGAVGDLPGPVLLAGQLRVHH